MEIRKRSTKAVARRHDLNYFKKGSPIRHWQWKLALAAVAVSLGWIAIVSVSHGRELLSKGPISSSHAVFGARCEACHVPALRGVSQNAGFRRHVPDAACQSCHQVPDHQSKTALASFATPDCGSCHVEHAGSLMLANASDKGCVGCHADLKDSHYASGIQSFVEGHPEFAPLRAGYRDDQQIKFNHQAHLQNGLMGPQGEVNLDCADCHRTPATQDLRPWRFGAPPQLRPASLEAASSSVDSRSSEMEKSSETQSALRASPLHPTDDRAYMAAATYAANCRDCHTLKFDKHIAEEAPHAAPAEVRDFIREKLRSYAAMNPSAVAAEIRNWPDEPTAKVPRYRSMPTPRNAEEWIAIRSLQAERRLWRQSCDLCHSVKIPDDSPAPVAASPHLVAMKTGRPGSQMLPDDGLALPTVASTNQKTRRLTEAIFSHQSHIAVSCESCHSRTRISNQGSDILLPGIASCRKCHDGRSRPQGPALASGHAESGCFLCHQYHDWSHPGTAPVTPRNFELKELSELQSLR